MRIFAGLLITHLFLSGCMQRIHDPHEVVDQSYIHRYGVPVEEDNWQAQGSTGQVVTSLKSGVIVTTSYSEGVLHGDTTYTYPHSDLVERRETYHNNQLQKEVQFYRNGTPSQETLCHSPTTSQLKSWYDNGVPKSQEHLENGQIVRGVYYDLTNRPDSNVENGNGQRTVRDNFGHITGVDTVVNGSVILTRTFHQNGAVKEEMPKVNGKMDGSLKTYTPDGVPISIETWVRGEKTGPTRLFENGEMIAEIPYIKGQKEGTEKRFRNGKVVVATIAWSADTKHGPSTTYIGETVKTDYFFQGTPVSRSAFEKMSAGRIPLPKDHVL